jgi:hypothetical protein
MRIKKIISGGQTGVDQAALDMAIEQGIPYGGWIPKGRKTEKGILPEKYKLQEMPTPGYRKRREMNVIDSDGTLLISHGELKDSSVLTQMLAVKHGRPWIHVDLDKATDIEAARTVVSWLDQHDVAVLNVTGPRIGKDPAIYETTMDVLRSVLCLDIIRNSHRIFLDSRGSQALGGYIE